MQVILLLAEVGSYRFKCFHRNKTVSHLFFLYTLVYKAACNLLHSNTSSLIILEDIECVFIYCKIPSSFSDETQ